MKKYIFYIAVTGAAVLATGCDKMLDIKDPVNSITTNQVFQSDEQAAGALNGLYSYLINGGSEEVVSGLTGSDVFSAGELPLLPVTPRMNCTIRRLMVSTSIT
ncbi:RagB/SusD family nutrient uptake outer membrane protein [Chitinophaga sedimenti]|uniref:RagB/SusD family nutrient uptake outer membrane protein n=1 Tax=Chitinophaga sedimenti TaxID=2033606 RepID=UPI00200567CF|nr:RagB/SusD family nutrient uptake outer membrane protein [Chitinophaga sedimenti]MCK7554086.1 RagB/SusD family nutrient uptake outer membrane protein [Chitinophaga sedimenti]